MNLQLIIIGILFAGAVFYLITLFRKSFSSRGSSCNKSCGCEEGTKILKNAKKKH